MMAMSRSDHGSVSAFVALFIFAAFVLMGLVIDGGSVLSARQAATDEAEQAARAGAGALAVNELRSGVVQINQQLAIEAAVNFTDIAGHPGTATVSGGVVTVVVKYRMPTAILGLIKVNTLPVMATASALDVRGVTVGS
jgi:uncharacterized membrane protein